MMTRNAGWRRWTRFVLLCGLLCASAGPAFQQPADAHEGHAALPSTGAAIDGDQLLLSEDARKAIGLETAKVSLADLHDVLRLNARIELPWKQRAIVTTLIPGRVAAVLVRPGEPVAAGQALARIESLELDSLQTEMLQAAEDVKLGRALLNQRQKLADQRVIAGADLLETQTELRQSTARLQIAIRKLRAIGLDDETINGVLDSGKPVRSISIAAPIGGVVGHAVARTGQYFRSSEQLFEIADLSSLWIVGEVLESDVSRVAAGMPVDVRFAGHRFTGEIAHVRLKMDETQRTVGVVIPVDNADGYLRPGMFGRMTIEIGSAKESIVCPVDALVEIGNETFALKRQGEGKYVRRPVQVGLRTREQVEIVSGLFPGDQVIVTGVQLLAAMFDAPAPQPSGAPGLERDGRPGPTDRQGPSPAPSSDAATVIVPATVELPTQQKTFAASLVEGRISRILVEPGQNVRAGQVLAEIDSPEFRNLQLELLQATARLSWAEETMQRIRPLADEGVTPDRELWQIEKDVNNARQTVSSLARQLSYIGLTEEQISRICAADLTQSSSTPVVATLPVRAGSDGTVAEFDLVPGQIVQPHDRMFEIHDLSRIWLEGYVFEQNVGTIRTGQSVAVAFLAQPGVRVKGTIVRVAPVMNADERILPIWMELEATQPFLREGMLAKAAIEVSKSNGPVAAAAGSK